MERHWSSCLVLLSRNTSYLTSTWSCLKKYMFTWYSPLKAIFLCGLDVHYYSTVQHGWIVIVPWMELSYHISNKFVNLTFLTLTDLWGLSCILEALESISVNTCFGLKCISYRMWYTACYRTLFKRNLYLSWEVKFVSYFK
jgi:hypothetical protein